MLYPPSPKGNFFLGVLSDFQTDSLGLLTRASKLGDISHLRLLTFHAYLPKHPSFIWQVLVEEPQKYATAQIQKSAVRPWVGESLLVTDGEIHRRNRKLVQPAFHHSAMLSYMHDIAAKTRQVIRRWVPGSTLDVKSAMSELTLEIIAKLLFGEDDVKEIAETIGQSVDAMRQIVGREQRGFPYPDWVPTTMKKRKRAAIAMLDQVVREIIAKHKSMPNETNLLSLLLSSTYEDGRPISDQQVRDEAITLMVAGHETSANLLTWIFYVLSQHPEIAEKIQAEVSQLAPDQIFDMETLGCLTYTDRVIKETLRMYPPVFIGTARQLTEDTSFGEYVARKGDLVLISPYIVHRDERWYPEPERFDPDRWTADFEKSLPKGAYIPFGAGPHVCIGSSLAMIETKICLAIICRDYCLTGDKQTILPKGEGTLVPAAPVSLTINRLHQPQ